MSIEERQNATARRIVSYEPALGPVDFGKYLGGRGEVGGTRPRAGTGGTGADRFGRADADRCPALTDDRSTAASYLDGIIISGELGPGARPFDIAWARQTIAACRDAAGRFRANAPRSCAPCGEVPRKGKR